MVRWVECRSRVTTPHLSPSGIGGRSSPSDAVVEARLVDVGVGGYECTASDPEKFTPLPPLHSAPLSAYAGALVALFRLVGAGAFLRARYLGGDAKDSTDVDLERVRRRRVAGRRRYMVVGEGTSPSDDVCRRLGKHRKVSEGSKLRVGGL